MVSDRITLFKKHLTLLCLIGTVIIPVINNFGLSLILSFISGDIMLETASSLLSYFISALNLVDLFLIFGVLVNSLVRFGYKESKKIVGMCIVRVAIIYLSYFLIGAIVTSNFASTVTGNIYYCLTNALIDLMLLAGAIALTLYLRSKYLDEKNTNITVKKFFNFKNPLIAISAWIVVLVSSFLLSGNIIDTVADITVYGAQNLTTSEIIYLVSPYVVWVIKTMAGYVIIWGCAKWLDTQWRNLSKTSAK